MKLFLLCLLAVAAHSKIITKVTVSPEAIESSDSAVTLSCEFNLDQDSTNNNTQPPIIYWMKGVSVDDADAVMIFKGYKYWNESLGEYREFFNGYGERAAVVDLEHPSLDLSGLTNADQGRYWCMVAEWSGRQQEGTDADSVALLRTTKTFVDTNAGSLVEVDENKAVSLPCSGKGTHDVVTWFKGPFHRPDNENFTHSEIGSFDTIGLYDLENDKLIMDPKYKNQMEIDAKRSLIIFSATSSARFWCELSYTKASNVELETARASTVLQVKFPKFVCDGKATGTYPDPEDCSMYYECVEGDATTYHRSCGYDGLVYDEINGYCDWAANVAPPCGTSSD